MSTIDKVGDTAGGLLKRGLHALREQPRGLTAIGVNGRISVVGDRVVISRKRAGLMAALAVGLHGDKTIPLASITAVELRKPGLMIRGYFRLSINGRDPNGGAIEAATDENAILLTRSMLKDFQAVHDHLVARIGRASAPASNLSVADEIRKLAELRDQGLLTDDEFTAHKHSLMRA